MHNNSHFTRIICRKQNVSIFSAFATACANSSFSYCSCSPQNPPGFSLVYCFVLSKSHSFLFPQYSICHMYCRNLIFSSFHSTLPAICTAKISLSPLSTVLYLPYVLPKSHFLLFPQYSTCHMYCRNLAFPSFHSISPTMTQVKAKRPGKYMFSLSARLRYITRLALLGSRSREPRQVTRRVKMPRYENI